MTLRRILSSLLCLLLPACTTKWKITGCVVDSDGRPFPGVSCDVVHFGDFIRPHPDGRTLRQSDAAGRFQVEVDAQYHDVLLVCVADGYVTRMTPVLRDQNDEQTISMVRGGTIQGRVQLDESLAADSLLVEFEGGEPWLEFFPYGGPIRGEVTKNGEVRSIDPLPPGPAKLRILSMDYDVPMTEVDVNLVANQVTTLADIDLRGTMTEIEISAIDVAGKPITHFDLSGNLKANERITYADADDGTGVRRFLVPSYALPLANVSIAFPGLRTAHLGDVSASVVGRLEPAIRIAFQLVPTIGRAENEQVHLLAIQPERGEFVRGTVDAEGIATLSFPTPDDWTLHATYEDGSGPQVPFDLLDDGSKPIVTITDTEETPRLLYAPTDALARARELVADTHARTD